LQESFTSYYEEQSGINNISNTQLIGWTLEQNTPPASIPEPASMALLGLGAIAAARRLRK